MPSVPTVRSTRWGLLSKSRSCLQELSVPDPSQSHLSPSHTKLLCLLQHTAWDNEIVTMKALIFKAPGATALYHIELEINHPG